MVKEDLTKGKQKEKDANFSGGVLQNGVLSKRREGNTLIMTVKAPPALSWLKKIIVELK